jgi:glycosyltransferase involved in cell wall biosynthesis
MLLPPFLLPNQILCSIVMPVYNGGRFLEAALDSIFAQTCQQFELLVIDDGSTDLTPTILARYASDARVKVLTQPHLGIVAALNTGLHEATTDLIVRLDADDLMAPTRLERQLQYMDAHPSLGGAGSYYYIIDEFGEQKGTQEFPVTTVEKLNRYIENGGNPIFPHPAMILRKSIVLALGGYREEFRKTEDVDLFLRMITAGHIILMQPEYLTYFRYHSASTTAMNSRQQFELNEILFTNFRRRRSGLPDLSSAAFKAEIARLSPLKRFAREARYISRACLHRRDLANLQDKKLTAMMLLASAAICDPRATVNKIKRLIHKR